MKFGTLFSKLAAKLRPPSIADEMRMPENDYRNRVEQESQRFAKEVDVNDLPPIFHYWSNTYLRPMLEDFGFSDPDQFFAKAISETPASAGDRRILSIGAGNCDTEVRVAQILASEGLRDWKITCLDLVPEMLERGRKLAEGSSLTDHFDFVVADFNVWTPETKFDVVMANQCLHHVVELEALFENIFRMLAERGRFAISDMIGRNGHQRWPEARQILEEFWAELPTKYRYNHQLRRQEDSFQDWDCSVEGFEGIRSQDILPLLCENFNFELFIPFGNVIDPFIDRGFGWNFDANAEWDRRFIDRVHEADAAAIALGKITPTHLICICSKSQDQDRKWLNNRDPRSYIRDVGAAISAR